jgi:hypothetical protein
MDTIYDFVSVLLFIAAAAGFFHRLRRVDEPLAPYMLISLAAAVANWLGEHGAEIGAILLLAGGAAFLTHLLRAPYSGEDGSARG